MSQPSVVAIYLHRRKAGPMDSVETVEAIAGSGLDGDTYFQGEEAGERHPDTEITLIEHEAVEAASREFDLPLSVDESRRNIVTSGVRLNPLVGKTFEVGGTVLEGMRLCHPCAHLQKLTRPGVLKALTQRGGLRARIVRGGTIRVGDPVMVPSTD